MTTTLSKGSKLSRDNKKKKPHFLNKWVRRRNCIYCFAVSVVCFTVLLVAIGLITWKITNIHYWIEQAQIRHNYMKENRSNFEAFFHSVCPVYPIDPSKPMPGFDQTYCNRYCEENIHMEFIFRRKDNLDAPLLKDKSKLNACPQYVEIRPCQNWKNRNDGHCEKEYMHNYVSISYKQKTKTSAGENKLYAGICMAKRNGTTKKH